MTKKRPVLVLATGNQGKIRELRDLLADVPVDLKSLRDFENIEEVDETGSTYRENAELKAGGFARQTGHLSLADDSGLEIEALGNRPGVHSARFAGTESGYDIKIPRLLAMLNDTRDSHRIARFVCVATIAAPDGSILFSAEGVCAGTIADHPMGDGGFGYDPIFIPDGYDRTFGELPDEVKRMISHRARATRLAIRYLLDFIAL